MKVNYAHLCDYAIIARDGKLSVLGIFNALRGTALPIRCPVVQLVFEVEVQRAELSSPITARVEVRNQDGKLLLKAEARMEMKAAAGRATQLTFPQVIGIEGMQFAHEGTYVWSIFLNDHLEKEVDCRVILVTPPKAAQP